MSSLMYGLIVTLFGMTIVFLVLIGLWGILSLMRPIFSGQQKQSSNTAAVNMVSPAIAESAATSAEAQEPNRDELIAVISAAISACIGSQSNLAVRSITRVGDETPIWGQLGRHEQMLNRL